MLSFFVFLVAAFEDSWLTLLEGALDSAAWTWPRGSFSAQIYHLNFVYAGWVTEINLSNLSQCF